ncbi:MAG: ABC transporter substrate-binding protein [Deinococcales bacterium]
MFSSSNSNKAARTVRRAALAVIVLALTSLVSVGLAQTKPGSVVRIGLGADARTMIPMTIVDETTYVQLQNMFDPLLIRQRPSMALSPNLAVSWKYTNPQTLILNLRHGVKFQNGDPFTAKDVVFTMHYIQNAANKSEYAARYAEVDKITALNDYTVEIHTKDPFPVLLDRLSEFLVMPADYFQKVGADAFRKHPVGTGAYEFVSHTPDQQLVLKANPNYWRGAPDIQQVVFKYIPEFSSRLAGLLTGELDIVKDIPPRSIPTVNASGTAKVEEITSSRINYIALVNLKPGPMQNVLVRQAMNYAVNVPLLIKSILDGHGTQVAGALPSTSACQDTSLKPYPYDPEKAKALIKQAGYDPSKLVFTLDTPNGRYPKDKQVAEAIAAQLSQIGITVHVRVNEWGTHLDRIVHHNTGAMFLLGWGPNFTAQNVIQPLFQKGWTYSGFTDPELETLIPQAVKVVDPTQSCKDWTKIQQLIYQKAPWIFLWQQHDIYGVSNKVAWTPRPDELDWMYEAKWAGK